MTPGDVPEVMGGQGFLIFYSARSVKLKKVTEGPIVLLMQ
jgi:hypothetical protein